MASHVMTPAERMCLHSGAHGLHSEFRGIFGTETIESLLLTSYAELAATASGRAPAVVFLCVHNPGRSQMALGWFTHLEGGRAIAWLAGRGPSLS